MIDVELLLGRLQTAVHRDHRRRRRRRLVATVAVLAVVGTASVAIAGTYADWWTNAEPVTNPNLVARDIGDNTIGVLVPDGTRKATVARTPDAALVAVATKTGGYCLIPSLVDKADLGNSCTSRSEDELRAYASPPGTRTPHWIAWGHLLDERAAALDLTSLGIAEPVPVRRGGFFLFDVPQSQWAALDDRHGPIRMLDARGGVVSSGCVWLGPAPGSRGSGDGWGALGGPGESCDMHVPIPVELDLSKAHKLVELTLSDQYGIYKPGDTIALWRAPSTDGRSCVFMALAGEQPKPVPGLNTPTSQQCDTSGSGPIQAMSGGTLVGGDHYTNLVAGFVDLRSGIVTLELESAAGAKDIAFANGAFLAELPSSPKIGKGPGPIPGAPYSVVGYDAHGARVAAARLP